MSNAIAVLKAFGDRGTWGVTDLAQQLGLSKSVTHRLLHTLAAGGLLEQDRDRGTYRVGMEFIRVARSAVRDATPARIARPHLERLAQATQEAVFLAILRGSRYISVDVVDYTHRIRSVVQVGDTIGLHAGAGGHVILAYQPEALLRALFDEPLVAYTDRTPCEIDALRAALERVRRQGYAYSNSEVTPGTAGVAVPLFDHDGRVVASVCVTSTSGRMTEERVAEIAESALATARDISRQLGHDGSAGSERQSA